MGQSHSWATPKIMRSSSYEGEKKTCETTSQIWHETSHMCKWFEFLRYNKRCWVFFIEVIPVCWRVNLLLGGVHWPRSCPTSHSRRWILMTNQHLFVGKIQIPFLLPMIHDWLVVSIHLKNISQWEGWHPIYDMEHKTCSKAPTNIYIL